MNHQKMKIVICGLSITSSWGNGHATTYRGLVRELTKLGHDVLFLECDKPWYADNRDLPELAFGNLALYKTLEDLKECFTQEIQNADAVIVGSYVPDGIEVGRWVIENAKGIKSFYDIDTPVTLTALAEGRCEYLHPSLIPDYDLYLSFTGGPTLQKIEKMLRSPCARALYCSVDVEEYYPIKKDLRWDLGYLGTYSDDRQWTLQRLLIQPARFLGDSRFVVAGPQYPKDVEWGKNVERIEHLPPHEHRTFYSSMRFTLNITRKDMIQAGYSPSVRLFEAAACGTPIISDFWEGLGGFFEIGKEILVAESKQEILHYLTNLPETERQKIGERARERVRLYHSAQKRATELEKMLYEALRRHA